MTDTKEVTRATNGAAAASASLSEQISEAERDLVLHNFTLLKQRASGGRDGEMRIAVRRDPASGVVEVTYCGVGDKADLGSLRAMYAKLRQGTRF